MEDEERIATTEETWESEFTAMNGQGYCLDQEDIGGPMFWIKDPRNQ